MSIAELETLATTATELDGLYEVVDGQIVEKPPMSAFEYELASIFQNYLHDHVRSEHLGRVLTEMLFDLRPAFDRMRRPDVAFISAASWPLNRRAPKTEAWAIVPELAIEIVSPTNRGALILEKVLEYFTVGVKQVWVVYPAIEQIYAYESPTKVTIFGRGDVLEGGTVLPGFRLAIVDLFDAPPDAA